MLQNTVEGLGPRQCGKRGDESSGSARNEYFSTRRMSKI